MSTECHALTDMHSLRTKFIKATVIGRREFRPDVDENDFYCNGPAQAALRLLQSRKIHPTIADAMRSFRHVDDLIRSQPNDTRGLRRSR